MAEPKLKWEKHLYDDTYFCKYGYIEKDYDEKWYFRDEYRVRSGFVTAEEAMANFEASLIRYAKEILEDFGDEVQTIVNCKR